MGGGGYLQIYVLPNLGEAPLFNGAGGVVFQTRAKSAFLEGNLDTTSADSLFKLQPQLKIDGNIEVNLY